MITTEILWDCSTNPSPTITINDMLFFVSKLIDSDEIGYLHKDLYNLLNSVPYSPLSDSLHKITWIDNSLDRCTVHVKLTNDSSKTVRIIKFINVHNYYFGVK